MRPWFEALPERLEYEIEAFAAADGLHFELDRDELEHARRVVFRGTLDRPHDEPLRLEVRYPDSYPYLRPEVFAPELRLPRHQNPYLGNLCLLDRSTREWNTTDTGPWLVGERVPGLLALIAGDPAEMRRLEAPQGEPASRYFIPEPGSVVFVPEEMLTLDVTHWTGIARFSVGDGEQLSPLFRACLSSVETVDRRGRRRVAARAGRSLAGRFGRTVLEGRWARLEHLPDEGTVDALLAAARDVPGFQMPAPTPLADGTKLRVTGVVCSEEVRQGEWEDGWLFVVQADRRQGKQRMQASYVAAGQRLSPADLGERIPTVTGLAEKTVAQVGLGAVGGPIALELARGQVGELRVLDGDTVEAGTIVRWPIGLRAVGRPKTHAIAAQIRADYPFTTVRPFDLAVGGVPAPGQSPQRSESEILTELLDGADIVVDATAEIGVQQLLAALANAAGIPQVYAWATEGGWGGVVARIVPGRTGCWLCLQLALDDGTIEAPPRADTGTIQPRGCAYPTWTGASFDAMPIVAQAVRTTAFTLLADGPNADGTDVFVCAQVARSASELAPPAWTAHRLARHPDCLTCGATETR